MTDFLSQKLLDSLATDIAFVSRVVYFASTPSTNDALMRMAADGAPEGTLVIADDQTAGRGRLDRTWIAPAGTSLLFSLLFRPSAEFGASPLHYVMVCALAVRDAVRDFLGLEIGLKWPNDLVFQGRKLGGILAEIETNARGVQHVVVGIGINVNWDPSAVELDQPATSLTNLTGHPVARGELLQTILGGISERYAALQAGQTPVKEWEAALETIGKPVIVEHPGKRFEGTAAGVDPDGSLLVRTSNGAFCRVVAGDVRFRPTD